MGDHHAFDRPRQYEFQRLACRMAIDEAGTPFSRCARIRREDPVKPRDEAAPAFEPVARQSFNQVREDRGAAGAVKRRRLLSSRNCCAPKPDLCPLPSPDRARNGHPTADSLAPGLLYSEMVPLLQNPQPAARTLECVADELRNCGIRALPIPTDVADAEAVDAAADRIEHEFGPIDVWVTWPCQLSSRPFTNLRRRSSSEGPQ